jgi:glyoxylase-like metal-dependent hydrolase (beta-lactamase superfamily II)
VSAVVLEIVQIRAGDMANFSYLVYCPRSLRGLAVDPSFAPDNLLAAAAERGVSIDILVNTHGHRDHIAGNGRILEATGARLAAHPLDVKGVDIPLTEGSVLSIGEGTVDILHTPGHTPGSIVLHPPGALITGDTLFVTCVGRADLAGSDPVALYHSLCRLAAFPAATRIYPGHDYGPQPVSSVAFELEHNPYLQCSDLADFLHLRMG